MLSIAIGTIDLPIGGWRSITVAGWAHFVTLNEGLIDAIGRQGIFRVTILVVVMKRINYLKGEKSHKIRACGRKLTLNGKKF